ncbi:MAG TPA: hypothetical protein VM143_13980 [Acidimicrobiales bacterium]|nr:hypothetical protein [Acidimicrobiales bacterium]
MAPETSKYEQLQVAQVVDLNPGIRAGLFWTVPVTDASVSVDLANGKATLTLVDVGVYDYTDYAAAFTATETGQPAVASLAVTWTVARDATGAPVAANPPDDTANLLHAVHDAANAVIVFSGWHVPDTARQGADTTVPLAFRSGTISNPVDPNSGPSDTRGQVTPALGEDPLGAAPTANGVIGTEKVGVYFPG